VKERSWWLFVGKVGINVWQMPRWGIQLGVSVNVKPAWVDIFFLWWVIGFISAEVGRDRMENDEAAYFYKE